jgi:hypothetical protein
MAKYRRSSTRHLLTETAWRRIDQGGIAALIAYDTETEEDPIPTVPVPKELRHEGVLFSRIASLGSELRIACHTRYAFKARADGSSVPTIVGLPIRPSGDADKAFDEIWSVQGGKFSEESEKLSYSFTLSRSRDREVGLDIRFTTRSKLDESLPAEILDRANEIGQRLVPVDGR